MNKSNTATWRRYLRDLPAKWRRRSRAERWLILEAFVLLGAARLGVLILPFRVLAKSLGTHMQEQQTPLKPDELQRARTIGATVRATANHTPWESVCLPQAIAAKWMLKRRRIASTLYLGVMKDETKTEKLSAHAWIRTGSVILTGAKGHRLYTVVSTFS